MNKVISIQGATASGKTDLALSIAQFFNTEIISADSRQCYREMSIGSAKPSKQELALVPHHFINSDSLNQPINVSNFGLTYEPVLQDILKNKGVAVVVGGSGQFVESLLTGLDEVPHFEDIQLDLQQQFDSQGLESLVQKLTLLDPETAKQIDLLNPRRVLRALEVRLGSGKSILSFQNQKKQDRNYQIHRFAIHFEREALYLKISDRVEAMIQMGLENEVRNILNYKDMVPFQTVGYKEWIPFFDGEISLEKVKENIKQHTRNYAKRQLTWIKQFDGIIWLDPKVPETLLQQLLKTL